ncbi:MAG: hypothetical protein D6808_04680, partial [Candidatus Dadabacteria bacterium]
MSGEDGLIAITIDGEKVLVKPGTNVIDAACSAGIEIPHYCYHRDLSVAGNCRMCQIEIEGRPRLEIGCNTIVQDGMAIRTHRTSEKVRKAQASVLEFILINHPLDCTVCDQSGHCKLQDYHYTYNARHSRFFERKEHKVKAVELGPNVMLDGERCILCTRCIRFCDEITKTSELGAVNRGDKTVITTFEGKRLDNPLSGTVVDLCPVGALTHKKWRFNSRIWYTSEADAVCPGCSTGCTTKVFERDNKVVLVKARYNEKVNREWLCDAGRYGLEELVPEERVCGVFHAGENADLANISSLLKENSDRSAVVVISSRLYLEEFRVIKEFFNRFWRGSVTFAVSFRERYLTETEKILISPDYDPNWKGAVIEGVAKEDVKSSYREALNGIRKRSFESLFFIGDDAIW